MSLHLYLSDNTDLFYKPKKEIKLNIQKFTNDDDAFHDVSIDKIFSIRIIMRVQTLNSGF